MPDFHFWRICLISGLLIPRWWNVFFNINFIRYEIVRENQVVFIRQSTSAWSKQVHSCFVDIGIYFTFNFSMRAFDLSQWKWKPKIMCKKGLAAAWAGMKERWWLEWKINFMDHLSLTVFAQCHLLSLLSQNLSISLSLSYSRTQTLCLSHILALFLSHTHTHTYTHIHTLTHTYTHLHTLAHILRPNHANSHMPLLLYSSVDDIWSMSLSLRSILIRQFNLKWGAKTCIRT